MQDSLDEANLAQQKKTKTNQSKICIPLKDVRVISTFKRKHSGTNAWSQKTPPTLNLYCVLLFRPCTVQVKFSPVYFG